MCSLFDVNMVAEHVTNVLVPLIMEEFVEVVKVVLQERSELFEAERGLLANPFAKVKGLITCLINRLQAEAPSEMSHTSYRDGETSMATEKKDFEADTAKHPSIPETAVSRSSLDGEVSSRDQILQCTVEQVLDVPGREMVEVPKTVSQDRIQQWTVEQIVDVPVPQVVEELVEVSKVFPQDKVQQCFTEQTIETPAILLAVKIIEVPVIRTQEKTQQLVNTHIKETVQRKKPYHSREDQPGDQAHRGSTGAVLGQG